MNVNEINLALVEGKIDLYEVAPNYHNLRKSKVQISIQFGLEELPTQPGMIIVRGARQFGKSTWLEGQLIETIKQFGKGSALYLNGDEISSNSELKSLIQNTVKLFNPGSRIKRLFIDEISAVTDWQKSLKRLADSGELNDVLVVCTGSSAADLRRGTELLPGRKGKLLRNTYLFTQVSYLEFKRVWSQFRQDDPLIPYIITGGCPLAISDLMSTGHISESTISMIKDWVFGECAKSGRDRGSLLGVLETILKCGSQPVGYAELARESGLANNTVASGYIEFLGDLLGVAPCFNTNPSQNIPLRRKPCKFHFINLMVATAFSRHNIRSVEGFTKLPATEQAKWHEWLVAAEIWRNRAIAGEDVPEMLNFWRYKNDEIDFLLSKDLWLEVKRGQASPHEFVKIKNMFPNVDLRVVCSNEISTKAVMSMRMEEFLEGRLRF